MSIPMTFTERFYKQEQFAILKIHKKYWLFGEVIYTDGWVTKDGSYLNPLRFDLLRSIETVRSNIFGTKLTCTFKPKR